MMASLEQRFESISVKGAVIAGLTLLMLWPLSQVESLISERQRLQHDAYAVIADGFGGPQVVGPPILSVDTEQRTGSVDSSNKISTDLWSSGPSLHLTPDDVQITSDVTVEIRSKGIYSVPVYVAKVTVTGQFKPDAMARLLVSGVDFRTLPSRATLQLPLSRVKYIRSLQRFEVGGRALHATGGLVAGLEALSVSISNSTSPAVSRCTFCHWGAQPPSPRKLDGRIPISRARSFQSHARRTLRDIPRTGKCSSSIAPYHRFGVAIL